MASTNQTAHYNLSQWEPGDIFVRTDFNEDNQKLDAGLHQAQTSADRTSEGLLTAAYNVHNLMLQSDCDGKQTGWGKGLVFDGFANSSRIAALTPAMILSGGSIRLSQTGQGNISLGLSTQKARGLTSRVRTASGNGLLTGFSYRIHSGMSVDTSTGVTYTLTVNGAAIRTGEASTGTVTAGGNSNEYLNFSSPVPVAAGDTLTIALSNSGSAWTFAKDSAGDGLGGTFLITPVAQKTGTLTAKAVDLPACNGLVAWARYLRGGVTLSARCGAEAPRALEQTALRTTWNLKGTACTEAAYRLDGPLPAGAWSFALALDTGANSDMLLYDYRIMLL